jgi:hypothetical protein
MLGEFCLTIVCYGVRVWSQIKRVLANNQYYVFVIYLFLALQHTPANYIPISILEDQGSWMNNHYIQLVLLCYGASKSGGRSTA